MPIDAVVEIGGPEDRVVPIPKEHPLTQKIRELMGNVKGDEFDWKEEWRQHLEAKHND